MWPASAQTKGEPQNYFKWKSELNFGSLKSHTYLAYQISVVASIIDFGSDTRQQQIPRRSLKS